MNIVSSHIIVSGVVQGVNFRAFTKYCADELGLSGTVENRPDGSVEINIVGESETIDKLIARLKKGNGYSRIDNIAIESKPGGKPRGEFRILRGSRW
ncbi:MAG: acylphosphatase [Calditrichaeota bacterium]|nr:acylphosphatase [Calditrichota bacterium]